MNIINNNVSAPSVNSAQTTPGAGAISSRDAAPQSVTPESDAYTPSTEWTRLVALLKQQPEVRADRVREVSQKLQSGAYSTSDSAEKTADAMLQGVD
jgi:anti-sigma28 factor (negative regulator of flagellin synthesis)